MRGIVIGASLSRKTTIIRHLHSAGMNTPVSEIDEELKSLNNDNYPTDSEYKNKVLAPKIIKDVLERKNVLFFTNTNYFTLHDLRKAKNKGFKNIQIDVGIDELILRNSIRVKNEGYDDLSKYLKGMVDYQMKVKKAGLVDEVISGTKPVEEVVQDIKKVLN